MKYIDADRLRAEIEKIYKSEIKPWLSGVSATSAIYDYVLPLIDSLQQEQQEQPIPNGLEEAAEISFDEAYALTEDYRDFLAKGLTENQPRPIGPHWFCEYAKNRFIAGAKWQEEQDQETIELAEEHAYLAGSVNEREKMMKEAVEGYVTLTLKGVRTVAATIKEEDDIGLGDKVRVIVLPKEN